MSRTRDEARVEQARVLASEGKTLTEIAELVGRDRKTLQRWGITAPTGRPRVADAQASERTLRRRRQERLALPEMILRARAPAPRRFPLDDPAALPAHVRDRLAVIGYWVCSRDLRDRVDGWDHLDEQDAAVAENDLELMGAVLAR